MSWPLATSQRLPYFARVSAQPSAQGVGRGPGRRLRWDWTGSGEEQAVKWLPVNPGSFLGGGISDTVRSLRLEAGVNSISSASLLIPLLSL